MPRMKSVGFDAAERVLMSRFGVYSARSAMFWMRRSSSSLLLKVVTETAVSWSRSSRFWPRMVRTSMSRYADEGDAGSAGVSAGGPPSISSTVGSVASWADEREGVARIRTARSATGPRDVVEGLRKPTSVPVVRAPWISSRRGSHYTGLLTRLSVPNTVGFLLAGRAISTRGDPMRAVLAILWILSVAAAFGLGRLTHPSGGQAALDTVESFRDALAEREPLSRAYRVSAFLRGLGPEELPAALAALEQDNVGVTREEVRLFMLAWSRFDAPGAFAWARAWPTQWSTTLTEQAIHAWAFRDAPGALRALETVEDPEQKALLQRALLEGWLHGPDRAGATGFLAALPDPRQRGRLAFVLAGEMARDGTEAVMRWAEAVPEDAPHEFKKGAFQLASGFVAREDPRQAAAWFEANRMHPYSAGSLEGIARKWAEYHEPPALFEWLRSLPTDGESASDTRRAVTAGFSVWIDRAPEDAEAWLASSLPDPELDPLIVELVRARSQASPASAIEWAARIQDPPQRLRSTIQAARVWQRQDPEVAGAWLAGSTLTEDQKQ